MHADNPVRLAAPVRLVITVIPVISGIPVIIARQARLKHSEANQKRHTSLGQN